MPRSPMMQRLFRTFLTLTLVLALLPWLFHAAAEFLRLLSGTLTDARISSQDIMSDTPLLVAGIIFLALAVLGAVAWHLRSPMRPEERLPGRQRALPPAPRG